LRKFYDTSCENTKCVERCEIFERPVGDEWMIEEAIYIEKCEEEKIRKI
jgi:hypothetical protein